MSILKPLKPANSGAPETVTRLKLFTESLSYFVPVYLLTLAITIGILAVYESAERRAFAEKEWLAISIAARNVANDVHEASSDLALLGNLKEMNSLWTDSGTARPEILDQLAQDYLNICTYRRMYDQLRLLNASGRELLRINFNDGHPAQTPILQLQEKGDRYYFSESHDLCQGEIFVSPLDLNMENGAVEEPLKPTMRFATPVFDLNGARRGVVVINYLGHILLERLSAIGNSYNGSHPALLNSDGFWLLAPPGESPWGFMYPEKRDQSFARTQPQTWNRIQTTDSTQFITSCGMYTSRTVVPLLAGQISSRTSGPSTTPGPSIVAADQYYWKVVSFAPTAILCKGRNARRKAAAFILVLAALFFLPASCKIAHAAILRKQAERDLHKANEHLEHRVAQRTAELQKQEAKFQQAQKTKSLGDLAGGIAHDFNNLLMAIQGNTDLALLTWSKQQSPVKFLHEIRKATSRAANLAKQMLAYSGRGHFVIESIPLNDMLLDMRDLLHSSISNRIDLHIIPQPKLPTFIGDVTQIQQVVLNLLTNASESMQESPGVIEIATGTEHNSPEPSEQFSELWPSNPEMTRPDNVCVYFEVRDTGCGMDPATLGNIFDPFFTTKFTGRGLGLSAVLGIVRGHKGGVRIHSKPGKGTVIRVLFPVVSQSGETASESPHSAKGLVLSEKNCVLVVDDEAPVRSVLKAMLEHMGFSVLTAENGREGLDAFMAHRTEICYTLLDLTMPLMDGEEAFKAIMKIEPNADVYICSGFDEQEVITRFENTGLAGFLKKPFSLSSLEEKLIPRKDSPL